MNGERPKQTTGDWLRAPTINRDGRRKWVYPERLAGKFGRWRLITALALMAVYCLLPFLTIDSRPLFRIDVMKNLIFIMGSSFRFTEGYFLVFVLVAVALFFAWISSLWGRIWCGFACPQTVFVDWLIRPIEEWIEGPANRRRRRDKAAWDMEKILRKTAKHLVFGLAIFLLSNILLAYFIDIYQLWEWMRSSPWNHPQAFLIMSFVFALVYFDLVWFREQFCSFLCPYARFQSLLISPATPTVAYDARRGEPRGRSKDRGACIDCGLCTRVCPTSIDIRDGLQLECIQCFRCADACNTIMKNLGQAEGLISFKSQRELDGLVVDKGLRTRPLLYFVGLLVVLVIFGTMLTMRKSADITVLRQAGALYGEISDGRIANYYSLRIVNRSLHGEDFKIVPVEGFQFICSLCGEEIAADSDRRGSLIVIFDRAVKEPNLTIQINQERLPIKLISPGGS